MISAVLNLLRRWRGRSARTPTWRKLSDGAKRAHYEEITGLLHGLVIRLDDRLSAEDAALITEFIDANELGLALEQLADVLSEDETPLAADERADMLALVDRMQMDDRVPRVLGFCPDRSV